MIPVPLLNPKFAIAICRTVCANFGFGALVGNLWIAGVQTLRSLLSNQDMPATCLLRRRPYGPARAGLNSTARDGVQGARIDCHIAAVEVSHVHETH